MRMHKVGGGGGRGRFKVVKAKSGNEGAGGLNWEFYSVEKILWFSMQCKRVLKQVWRAAQTGNPVPSGFHGDVTTSEIHTFVVFTSWFRTYFSEREKGKGWFREGRGMDPSGSSQVIKGAYLLSSLGTVAK